LKVVRFHEENIYQPVAVAEVVAETGWSWTQRYAILTAAAVVLGVLVWGSAFGFLLFPLYRDTGALWPLILWLILVSLATFFFQYWLGQKNLLRGLAQSMENFREAAVSKVAIPKESTRKNAGKRGAEMAAAMNGLLAIARAETGLAPLAAYRESFLAGAQPSYLCDFRSGRFLDCNHAFADFIGMEREAVLAQRLGDITVGSQATTSKETGMIPSIALENTPAVEMRFRHASGNLLQSVVFLRPIDDPARHGRVIHCAVVVPQEVERNETK
jgi:PAS domain-containing protein